MYYRCNSECLHPSIKHSRFSVMFGAAFEPVVSGILPNLTELWSSWQTRSKRQPSSKEERWMSFKKLRMKKSIQGPRHLSCLFLFFLFFCFVFFLWSEPQVVILWSAVYEISQVSLSRRITSHCGECEYAYLTKPSTIYLMYCFYLSLKPCRYVIIVCVHVSACFC